MTAMLGITALHHDSAAALLIDGRPPGEAGFFVMAGPEREPR